MPSQTTGKIIATVAEMTDKEVTAETKLADLELDSLDLLDLVFILEGEYDIELQQTRLQELMPLSIEDIAGQVDAMVKDRAAA